MEKHQNRTTDTMISDRRLLTGMFADRVSAENAYNSLRERGYSKDDINLRHISRIWDIDYIKPQY